MRLEPTTLTASEQALREEVRCFLDARLSRDGYLPTLGEPACDPAFSRELAARGWVGMALPAAYGGGGRTAVERLVVAEELLARAAPVTYHWTADRQSGPSIAAHGTEEQKRFFLPRIAAAELCFAIGMSEPDSGSDLASLRTTARSSGDGWLINASKIWTSLAHVCDYILVLVRTSDEKHGALTQFIVPRETPGLSISTIPFIDGSRNFCVLTFEDAYVPDTLRLGPVGNG